MTDAPATGPVPLRAVLAAVPAYVAGRPAEVRPGTTVYKLSSNENPYPPLPSVQRVIADAAAQVNRYPDMGNTELVAALAARFGVGADQVTVGTGSTGVLAQLIAATCSPGDNVVFAWRSFEAYPILVQLAGATPRPVALTASGEHDLAAMAAAVDGRTRLVFLCSPNNPTGPALTDADVRSFLARIPENVGVVLDEAYVEFVRDPRAVDGPALLREFPNLIVLRTFSKAYGLAGLRVGYALAHPGLAGGAAKAAIPFGVNLLAQAAAVHALGAEDELGRRVDALVAERDRVARTLADQGWRLPSSQANFVYFPLGRGESELFDELCSHAGLVVRRFGTEGVRVTIGEEAANDRLLQLTASVRSPLRG